MNEYFLIREKVTTFLQGKCLTCKIVHPLTGIPNKYRDEFWKALEPDERAILKAAIKYYQEHL